MWYFEGKELAFSQQTSKNGSVWIIRSVQFSDEGFYSCKVAIPGFGSEVISEPAKVTIFSKLICKCPYLFQLYPLKGKMLLSILVYLSTHILMSTFVLNMMSLILW